MANGRVVLEGMEFHAFHGVLAEEGRLGARFTVDVEMTFTPGHEDKLAQTVDYSRVYTLVRRLVTGSKHRLIETLAQALARSILEEEPLVDSITVRVHKPHAPLPGIVRDVFAEFSLDRG